MSDVRRDPAWLLLGASAVLMLLNGFTLAWEYSQHSVQMDLFAFYARASRCASVWIHTRTTTRPS